MSPYLFVIAMEYQNREMTELATNKMFKLHLRCKRFGVIHMCFADIRFLQENFQRFSHASGLATNADKSSIYIARMNLNDKEDIVHMLGFTLGCRYQEANYP